MDNSEDSEDEDEEDVQLQDDESDEEGDDIQSNEDTLIYEGNGMTGEHNHDEDMEDDEDDEEDDKDLQLETQEHAELQAGNFEMLDDSEVDENNALEME